MTQVIVDHLKTNQSIVLMEPGFRIKMGHQLDVAIALAIYWKQKDWLMFQGLSCCQAFLCTLTF